MSTTLTIDAGDDFLEARLARDYGKISGQAIAAAKGAIQRFPSLLRSVAVAGAMSLTFTLLDLELLAWNRPVVS